MSKLDTPKSQHCAERDMDSDMSSAGEIAKSRNDQVRSETGGVCEIAEMSKSDISAKGGKSEISWNPRIPGSSDLTPWPGQIWEIWDFLDFHGRWARNALRGANFSSGHEICCPDTKFSRNLQKFAVWSTFFDENITFFTFWTPSGH